MRIKIIVQPTQASIDGVQLSQFEVGAVYAVPAELATVLIVEGWAEPVDENVEPKLPAIRFNLIGPNERRRRIYSNWRLRVELGLAADRRKK